MSTSGIERKFERFMIGLRQERQMHPPKKEKPGKIIGHITYDFENQTEKFTPTLRYKIISSFNQFYSRFCSYFHNQDNKI